MTKNSSIAEVKISVLLWHTISIPVEKATESKKHFFKKSVIIRVWSLFPRWYTFLTYFVFEIVVI